MSTSRRTFLAGTTLLGMTSALSGVAVAATGEQAIMLTLWVTTKPSPYHMISVIGFDSMNALTAAIESPAGKAMVDDLKNFAARTSVLIFSTIPA
jgi:hypothetical protein